MSDNIALYRWRTTNPAKRGTLINLGPGLEFKLDADGLFPAVLPSAAETRLRELKAAGLKYEQVAMNSAALWTERIRVVDNEVKMATEAALRIEGDLIAARALLRLAQERAASVRDDKERADEAWQDAEKKMAQAGATPQA